MARSKSRKSCPSGKVMNPASGRCVSAKGKIGKGIKGTRKSPSAKKTKGCPSGKVMNPATGRCVSVNGKIGRGLMGKKPRASKPRKGPSRKPEEKAYRKTDDKPEDMGETYQDTYNRWYKYYYEMLRNVDCKELDAREISEMNNLEDSDDADTAIRRPALGNAIRYLRRICENENREEVIDEPACEVDNYNPDDLSCKKTSAMYLHPDKNPSCPKKASAKFDRWRKRCNQ